VCTRAYTRDPHRHSSNMAEESGVACATYTASDIERKPTRLQPPLKGTLFHVYCSPLNPGARELLSELREERHLDKLKLTTDVRMAAHGGARQNAARSLHTRRTASTDAVRRAGPGARRPMYCAQVTDMRYCEQMLLYLRDDTWNHGNSESLAEEVMRARRLHMPLLLVHEQIGLGQEARRGVAFEAIIASTPRARPLTTPTPSRPRCTPDCVPVHSHHVPRQRHTHPLCPRQPRRPADQRADLLADSRTDARGHLPPALTRDAS